MLSPLPAIVGALLCFAVSITLFKFEILSPAVWFFLPVFILIAYHTVVMQLTSRPVHSKNAIALVIKKSLCKYLFWLAIIAGAYWIYTTHPFYVRFAPQTTNMVKFYLQAYAMLGFPYFFYVERYRTGRFEWFNDHYLKFLSLLKVIYKRQWRRLRFRVLRRGYKSLLLSWVVRLHFLPVMVQQVYWGTSQTMGFLNRSPDPFPDVMFFIGVLFLIDATNASIGYFWESALTRTRFRAIDPNTFHWVVVAMCYVPFIGFAGTFIPFPEGKGALLFAGGWFEPVVNTLTVLALAGIVLSTTCLGFSYSNLSFKKIQTRGPYRLVRHPGTVFKIAFFFLTVFRFKASFTFPIIAAYVFWMGIYITRILCEERFLMNFKEYQDYARVTRYRLIPGVW